MDAVEAEVGSTGGQGVRWLVSPCDGRFPHLVQHAVRLQEAGHDVLWIAVDRPANALMEPFTQGGVDPGRIRFLDLLSGQDYQSGNTWSLPSPTLLELIALRTRKFASDMQRPWVVLDSLEGLCLYNHPDAVAQFCHYLGNALRMAGIPLDLVAREPLQSLEAAVDSTVALSTTATA